MKSRGPKANRTSAIRPLSAQALRPRGIGPIHSSISAHVVSPLHRLDPDRPQTVPCLLLSVSRSVSRCLSLAEAVQANCGCKTSLSSSVWPATAIRNHHNHGAANRDLIHQSQQFGSQNKISGSPTAPSVGNGSCAQLRHRCTLQVGAMVRGRLPALPMCSGSKLSPSPHGICLRLWTVDRPATTATRTARHVVVICSCWFVSGAPRTSETRCASRPWPGNRRGQIFQKQHAEKTSPKAVCRPGPQAYGRPECEWRLGL